MFVNPLTHRVWPENLQEFGLDPEKKDKFNSLLDGFICEPFECNKDFLSKVSVAIEHQLKIIPHFYMEDAESGSAPVLSDIVIDAGKLLGPERSLTFKVFNLTTGVGYVKKKINTQKEQELLYEISKHRIVGIHHVWHASLNFSIVQLYQEDLCQYYERRHSFLQTSKIISDLIKGLGYLHSLVDRPTEGLAHKVFHADLKPKNIFVSPDGAVIGDFGLASRTDRILGTPFFMPPEKLKLYFSTRKDQVDIEKMNRKFGQQADIWGLGLIFSGVIGGFDREGYLEMPLLMKRFFDRFHPKSAKNKSMKDVAFLKLWINISEMEIRREWAPISSHAMKDDLKRFSILIPGMLDPDPAGRLSSALALEEYLPLLDS